MKNAKFLILFFIITSFISCVTYMKPTHEVGPLAHPDTPYSQVSLVPKYFSPNFYCRQDERGFVMIFQNSGTLESNKMWGSIKFNSEAPIPFLIPEIPAKNGNLNGTEEIVIRDKCINNCSYVIQWSNQPQIIGQCIQID